MLRIIDGSSEHGANIIMKEFRYFDLLKAFGNIEMVVKSDFFFSEKTFFISYVRNVS